MKTSRNETLTTKEFVIDVQTHDYMPVHHFLRPEAEEEITHDDNPVQTHMLPRLVKLLSVLHLTHNVGCSGQMKIK